MSANTLSKVREMLPTAFNDFFKPWNEWFDGGGMIPSSFTVPSVNVTEEKGYYNVTMAVPGMNKKDFSIDVDGNMLTISAASEQEKEEKDKKFTRREYNYSSFSRSFTLPDEVVKERIDATYTDGILTITLPKKDSAENATAQKVEVK